MIIDPITAMSDIGLKWRSGNQGGDMEKNAQILGDELGANVIQLPGRKYPAIALQGDSLNNLNSIASALLEAARGVEQTDSMEDLAKELVGLLSSYQLTYEKALAEKNIEKPY